jgi:CheY-like chemotaxis protein
MDTVAEAKTKKRVLVVDDEPEIRDLLYMVLTAQGLDVDLAASAPEALEFFRQHHYDMVTLDFCMPGMDGLEFQQQLSEMYGFGQRLSPMLPQRLPPTLVITAYSSEDLDKKWLASEQIVGVMQKPIRIERFLAVVQDVLSWNETRRDRRSRAMTRLGERVVKPMTA